jgi:hypothetical protein
MNILQDFASLMLPLRRFGLFVVQRGVREEDVTRLIMKFRDNLQLYLQRFHLTATLAARWDCAGLASFVSGLTLTHLVVDIHPGLSITDKTLIRLGRALPALRVLYLIERGIGPFIGNLTVVGIAAFLTRLPGVEDLAINFNANATESRLGREHVIKFTTSNLLHLDVQSSLITTPIPVAELLSTLAPKLLKLDFAPAKPSPTLEGSRRVWCWETVWECQAAFKRVEQRKTKPKKMSGAAKSIDLSNTSK